MKSKTAREIMRRNFVSVKKDAVLTEAIRLLLDHDISTLPVLNENAELVGIMSEHDIINFIFSGDADDTSVSEAMSREVTAFPADTDMATLMNCCLAKHIRVIPIVEGSHVLGIVGRRDILREALQFYQNQ